MKWKKERKEKERKKERTKDEISNIFVVIFKERNHQSEEERKKRIVICGLPHQKRKEKKADKLSGKNIDMTIQRFLQFLSSSAWLCIFGIYIDSNKEEREKERESPFLKILYNSTIILHRCILVIIIKHQQKYITIVKNAINTNQNK